MWNIVVAIPVKNEVERIRACLDSLVAQRGQDGFDLPPFDVLLFVNNSDDGTADVATAFSSGPGFRLNVTIATLPPEDASAGGARRRAMEAAASILESRAASGLLLTTDADSRVPPDWIASTIAAIEGGADAVAGTLMLDPDDEAALPEALKARGALEARYESLVCELESALNPQPHDPWPRHPTESGASFALTLASFRAVGGVPNMPLGEDRALAAALRAAGFRVRHDPNVKVVTSGRLFGRAEGGCADTMRRRIDEPGAHCDSYLRPAFDILKQRPWRKRVGREVAPQGRLLAPRELPAQILIVRAILVALTSLRLTRDRATAIVDCITVGFNTPRRMLGLDNAISPDPDAEPAAPS